MSLFLRSVPSRTNTIACNICSVNWGNTIADNIWWKSWQHLLSDGILIISFIRGDSWQYLKSEEMHKLSISEIRGNTLFVAWGNSRQYLWACGIADNICYKCWQRGYSGSWFPGCALHASQVWGRRMSGRGECAFFTPSVRHTPDENICI
jgi:hypothetical protein